MWTSYSQTFIDIVKTKGWFLDNLIVYEEQENIGAKEVSFSRIIFEMMVFLCDFDLLFLMDKRISSTAQKKAFLS